MKTQLLLLRIAAVISLLFMVFHFFFSKMFNWNVTLNCLDVNNRAILLTYHYVSFLITFAMGVIPLVQGKQLLSSPLRYSVLSLFSLFYIIRIYTEFSLFGITTASPVILIMCLVPAVFYAIPIFKSEKKN
jgi:hypothetical protein